ncbi:Hypothetical_protein [Hexamita inflata]|uniref:Hypothetical_protein n=1 Tax=Hexamita inflata TaxID=28002 RepID=A0AA86TX80_9EUKA|nr:Hypothetical protein HINF_LOCUS18047 [Hexamita inflata]
MCTDMAFGCTELANAFGVLINKVQSCENTVFSRRQFHTLLCAEIRVMVQLRPPSLAGSITCGKTPWTRVAAQRICDLQCLQQFVRKVIVSLLHVISNVNILGCKNIEIPIGVRIFINYT